VVINRIAYYISQGRVETPIMRGGQFCCSFVANLLQYLFAKNYQNTTRFDKVIAKIEGCSFFASQCRNCKLSILSSENATRKRLQDQSKKISVNETTIRDYLSHRCFELPGITGCEVCHVKKCSDRIIYSVCV